MVKQGALFQEDDADATVDAQELLVQMSKLRAQLQAATQNTKRLEDENRGLRSRIDTLELDNAQMIGRVAVLERKEHESERQSVANVRIEAHDPSLHGLNEGDPGYADAKSKILEKRLMDLAKSEYWLRAELSSAKDEATEARRRQLQAERSVGELLRERGDLVHGFNVEGQNAAEPSLARGSAIFEEEGAFAEGLPKTIPARAARCAGLIASAITSSGSMRGSVGRTVATSTGAPTGNPAPSARPGNVWATLMNGGAAGNKMDFT